MKSAYKGKEKRVIDAFRDLLVCAMGGSYNGKALLLFSGGRDSSAVATIFLHAFPEGELHLLTLDNGVVSGLESSSAQAKLIHELHPGKRMVTSLRSVAPMMQRYGMQQIQDDFTVRGYKTLLTCAACKMCMSAAAADYAHENDIQVVLDGYAKRQANFPEQTETFISALKDYYKSRGITALSPLYDELASKDRVNELLEDLGLTILKQEPKCMFAHSFTIASDEDIKAFVAERLAMIVAGEHGHE